LSIKQTIMAHFTPKKISIVIIVVVLAWIATGLVTGTKHGETEKESVQSGNDLKKLLKIETLDAKPYTRLVTINGFTGANRMVELKPEVEGKVVELPVKKGQWVEKGQLIVRLDDRDRREKLAEAKAKLAARTLEYSAAQELESKGYRPRIAVADSKAAIETARLELAQAQLNCDNTRIVAPFGGRLEELNVEIGDFVLAGYFGSIGGKAMARIVEDEPIKVSGQISEKDLPTVDKDAEVAVVLSDNRELKGRISYLSQYGNMESRSFGVEVTVPNPNHDIPVGMTATIKLPASEGDAYLVSSSVLALDDAGKVGVKLVDDANVVQFSPVEILANTDEGLWIGGLPAHVRLVTQGQAFVNAGQKIGASSQPGAKE
jgi:multidrug efflux system membrane fusion protein